jgi:hypothetical protein
MRVFLGSSGLGAVPSFVGVDPAGLRMVFVPTAARHPHYNWEERSAPFPRLLAEYGDRFRLLPLADGQALIVDDSGARVVRSE